jgi:hypothetical protein
VSFGEQRRNCSYEASISARYNVISSRNSFTPFWANSVGQSSQVVDGERIEGRVLIGNCSEIVSNCVVAVDVLILPRYLSHVDLNCAMSASDARVFKLIQTLIESREKLQGYVEKLEFSRI